MINGGNVADLIWQFSRDNLDHVAVGELLGVLNEVVNDSSTHLIPPVVSKMEHAPALSLSPVFPAMRFKDSLVQLAILVHPVPGVFPYAISVETGVHGHLVEDVQLVDLLVDPVNFL